MPLRTRVINRIRTGPCNYQVHTDPVSITPDCESGRTASVRTDEYEPFASFMAKKRNRSLETKRYSISGSDTRGPQGDVRWFDGLYPHHVWGIMAISPIDGVGKPLNFGGDPAIIDRLLSEVTGKIFDKIKNQKINLGQAFGERKQTAGLLHDNAVKFLNSVRAARKGDMGQAAKFLGLKLQDNKASRGKPRRRSVVGFDSNELSSRVLELQFGWKPLLSDIYGACEQIADTYHRPTRYSVASNMAFQQSIDTSDSAPTHCGGMINHHVGGVDYAVKMRVQFGIDSEAAHTATQIGISDPLVVAWELTPWSFVLDYFVSVGDYLGRLQALDGISFKRGTISTSWKGLVTTVCLPGGTSSNPLFQNFGGVASSERRVYQLTRSRMTGFPPIPTPSLKKDPFSPEHVINLIALARQQFKVR